MKYAFESLTSISFLHTYYTNGQFTGFRVVPAPQTERALQNHGVIFKREPAGFRIIFDTLAFGSSRTRREVLDAGLVCEFYLELQDRQFYNYTDLPAFELRNNLFVFSNLQAAGKEIKQSIHRRKFVGEEDIHPISDLQDPPFVKPFGLIRLHLNPDLPESYQITFSTRQTYWRYILTGKDLLGLQRPAILDGNGAAAFEGPEDLVTPSGKSLAFRSLQPISLTDRSTDNFQLVENFNRESGRYKVVMRALPRADPSRINALPNGANESEHINYSEIFIH